MTDERRQSSRHLLSLDCEWGSASYLTRCRISDLSLTGCYIDSRMIPGVGSRTEIRVTLEGVATTLAGVVVYVHRGMGFGVRFDPLADDASDRLRRFLEQTTEGTKRA